MKTFNKDKPEGNKSYGKGNRVGSGSVGGNRNENGNGNKFSKGKFNSKPGGKFGNNRNKNGGDGIKFIANKKTIVVDENRKNLRRLYNRLMMKDSKQKKLKKQLANKKQVLKSTKILHIHQTIIIKTFSKDNLPVLKFRLLVTVI